MTAAAVPVVAGLRISVVICAYTLDRWTDTVAAVRSVQMQTLPPGQIVLVVDHNPELSEQALRELPEVVVVDNHNGRGLSGARNTGIAVADADVVAFLDDDACAEPTWLETLAGHYADERVLGVGGGVRPSWRGAEPAWFPPEFNWVVGCSYRGLPVTTAPVRNFIGANMSFRRSAFDGDSGFTEGIGRVGAVPLGCEETEFCIRLRRRFPDAVLLYDPRAEVAHAVPATRTTWSYFSARCRAEGLSKAHVSRLVGSEDALESERAYVRHTLPAGVAQALRQAPRRGVAPGVKRAGAIAAGTFLTGVGYAQGKVRSVVSTKSVMKNELVRGATTATPFNVSYRVGRVSRYLTGRWLDCGCADGGYTEAILAAGATEVVGIDVEEDRIAAARERVPAARFEVAASEALPFEDGYFDGAFLNEVFEHVASEDGTLADVFRVLRPGGHLILISPNRWFPFEGHEIHVGRWVSQVPTPGVPWLPRSLTNRWTTARNYWPHELIGQITAAGYEIVESGFILPVLEEYPWLPERVVQRYRSRIDRLDDMPALRRFGVSNLVVARRPLAAR